LEELYVIDENDDAHCCPPIAANHIDILAPLGLRVLKLKHIKITFDAMIRLAELFPQLSTLHMELNPSSSSSTLTQLIPVLASFTQLDEFSIYAPEMSPDQLTNEDIYIMLNELLPTTTHHQLFINPLSNVTIGWKPNTEYCNEPKMNRNQYINAIEQWLSSSTDHSDINTISDEEITDDDSEQ
jgi:hypothetical protein